MPLPFLLLLQTLCTVVSRFHVLRLIRCRRPALLPYSRRHLFTLPLLFAHCTCTPLPPHAYSPLLVRRVCHSAPTASLNSAPLPADSTPLPPAPRAAWRGRSRPALPQRSFTRADARLMHLHHWMPGRNNCCTCRAPRWEDTHCRTALPACLPAAAAVPRAGTTPASPPLIDSTTAFVATTCLFAGGVSPGTTRLRVATAEHYLPAHRVTRVCLGITWNAVRWVPARAVEGDFAGTRFSRHLPFTRTSAYHLPGWVSVPWAPAASFLPRRCSAVCHRFATALTATY